MFSRRTRVSLALTGCLAALLGLSGCDYFLKGRTQEQEKRANLVKLSMDEVQCLQNTSRNLQLFFKDEGSPQTLSETVGCVRSSLKTFMRLTRGSQPNGYLASEVQYFFNTFLLKDSQISNEFLAEIMKVKVVAVGGSPDLVTKLELEQFGDFLGRFEVQLQKLQGKMRATFFNGSNCESSRVDVAAIQADLKSIGEFILKNTKITSSRYQWTDLIEFLNQLNLFIGDSKVLDPLLRWVPLAENLKVLFLDDNAKLVSQGDWETAVTWTLDSYSTALRFYYEIKDNPLQTPDQWRKLIAWVDEGIRAVESSPAMRDKKILQAKALDSVIEEIARLDLLNVRATETSPQVNPANWLDQGMSRIQTALSVDRVKSPSEVSSQCGSGNDSVKSVDGNRVEKGQEDLFKEGLPANIVKAVYRQVLVHFVEAQVQRGNPLTVQGLTEAHLRFLKQEYNVWKLSQNFLIDVYSKSPRLTLAQLRGLVEQYRPEAQTLSFTPWEKDELVRSWADYRNLLKTQPVTGFNSKLKLTLQTSSENLDFPFVGANLSNSLRSFTRLVLRGYGDPSVKFPFDKTITKASLIKMEEDFREFGREIGLLDYREKDSASRTFDQGNFFTYHGNGDQYLTSIETYELFTMLVSGARSQLREMYSDLSMAGCIPDSKHLDIFKMPYVNEACFLNRFRTKASDYLDHMPGMANFIVSLDHREWSATYSALFSLVASKTHQNGLLESSEIRSLNTILHFIETLMVVYDRDQNSQLSEQEVLAALPRFQAFIRTVIAKRDSALDRNVGPYFTEDIFLHLVFRGRVPSAGDLISFKLERLGNLGEVSRSNILQLLSVLSRESQ